MDDIIKNLEKSMGEQKTTVEMGVILSSIFQMAIANSYTLREVLTRQIELEQKLTEGTADPDKAWIESGEIVSRSVDQARISVESLAAKFALDKDHPRS